MNRRFLLILPMRIAATVGLTLLAFYIPRLGQSLTIEATTRDSTHIDVHIGEVVDYSANARLLGNDQDPQPRAEVHLQCVSQGGSPGRFIWPGLPIFYQ